MSAGDAADTEAFHGYVYDVGGCVCWRCADDEHDADLAALSGTAKARFEAAAGVKVTLPPDDALRTAWVDHLLLRDGVWPREAERYLEELDAVGVASDEDDPAAAVAALDDDELANACDLLLEERCSRCDRLLAEAAEGELLHPTLAALLAELRRRGLLSAS